MFYALAIGSMLAYALQNTLLVHHARKIDGLSLTLYRQASFVVTLLPLLIGSSWIDVADVLSHWQLLCFSAITGGIYLSLIFTSYQFLNVGFASTINIAVATVSTAAFGWLFLEERLSAEHIALIGIIVAGVLLFGFRHSGRSGSPQRKAIGVGLTLLSGLLVSLSKFSFSVLSREANPLVSGYFWELGIGVACLLLILVRMLLLGTPLQRVKAKTFGTIALVASPTLIGTGLFGLAVATGPIAIVGAVGSGSLVVITLLAWALYGEKLPPKEWAAVAIVLTGIAGLKFL